MAIVITTGALTTRVIIGRTIAAMAITRGTAAVTAVGPMAITVAAVPA